jgi:hypothetical protein
MINIIRLAKTYCLAPLPNDWKIHHKNFEEKTYVFMRKIFIPYHPGILYFRSVSETFLAKPMQMKNLTDHLKPNTKIPLIGDHVHVNVNEDGKVEKTDLKILHQEVMSKKEFLPRKLRDKMVGRKWWTRLGSRNIVGQNNRNLKQGQNQNNIFLEGNTIEKRSLYQEKLSVRNKFTSWAINKANTDS